MKNKNHIKRFNEETEISYSKDEQELINMIEDIIGSEVYIREVPYSMGDGDMEKDPYSVTDAAKSIVNMLKTRFDLILK